MFIKLAVCKVGNRFRQFVVGFSIFLATLSCPAVSMAAMTQEEYARLYAEVSIVIAEVGRAQLGWLDGQDPSAPANDPGRGVSRWFDHFLYAVDTSGRQTVPQLVLERLQTIQAALPVETNAKLYADLSVIIATAGRRGANWVDGSDPNAPANDSGRGISCLSAHYSYVINGATNAPQLVSDRLATLML